jgi:hypothetical protein
LSADPGRCAVAPDRSVIPVVVGPDATSAAGAAYDATRGLLYHTSENAVRRIAVDAAGHPTGAPEVFATLPGTRLDGIVLDACGDSDPSASRLALWYVRGDTGAGRRIATFDDWVSGAQFGAGDRRAPSAGSRRSAQARTNGVSGCDRRRWFAIAPAAARVRIPTWSRARRGPLRASTSSRVRYAPCSRRG